MKILITGIAGFAGSNIAKALIRSESSIKVFGFDNLSRQGVESNLAELKKMGVELFRGDVRLASDIDLLPPADWVIDCSANPSVLAGMGGETSSRQLMENNLVGTLNLLEYCKRSKAGFILLSTSRVYSAVELSNLPVAKSSERFDLRQDYVGLGVSSMGLTEDFPTTAPISLYGASKLASETLVLEYGETFNFPVWINRCGVLAGAGQFGRADQGIFSYWIHSCREKRPLEFISFEGSGFQVRDALHPTDLVTLLIDQMLEPSKQVPKIINLGGGHLNSISLKELNDWCQDRFGPNQVRSTSEKRALDAPWIVMDSELALKSWGWQPTSQLDSILLEIAEHAENHSSWLDLTK